MPENVDYLVIGAGPAGLQLAYLLGRAGRNHLVLEAGGVPGAFFVDQPRHRQMISINKPHTGSADPELNLRVDWNSLLCDDDGFRFTGYTDRYFPDADDYLRYLADFARRFDLAIRYHTRVVRVARAGDDRGGFLVTDEHGGQYRARRVIAAIGFGATNVPPIEGIELARQYADMSIDPDDYTDQRVLIIGKANSAFETADALTERAAVIHVVGPHSLKMAWKTHFIGHLRAVNNNFLDTYQLKTQNSVLDATVERIERDERGYWVTMSYARRDETVRFRYDAVLCCTGFRMDASFFAPDCRPATTINDRFPALTSAWESVSVPDLYFAGTLTQSRDFKEFTSAFIHGFRYGVRALSRMLDQRYERTPWPGRPVPRDPAAIADALLARANRTSGLWQQFTFLADVVCLSADGARYLEEVPRDYLADGGIEDAATVLTLTMEYGPGHEDLDPFDVAAGRAWEAQHGRDDRYLHPVVRLLVDGTEVAVHRIKENLDNEWTDPVTHRAPLVSYLTDQLAAQSR